MLLGIGVFLFWWLGYPFALSYQEQNQLFLWTWDYLAERIIVPGGMAAWISELVVQFYYIPWLGALLLSLLFMTMQQAAAMLLPKKLYVLSIVPVAAMWWLMGDIHVLLSLPIALLIALLACIYRPKLAATELIFIPLLYWLTGPIVWVYIIIRIIQTSWRQLWTAAWLVAIQTACYLWLTPQWPLQQMMTTGSYYRIPLHFPQWSGYDSDTYELLHMDYLVRNERWDDILKRAGEREVRTDFWSNCVNLALSQKRLLADRMFDYYQSGEGALLMPMHRDQTSNLPTAEAFFRLGLINSAQRYMFDIQESITDGKKSGRCTKRIVECMIINGHYKTAKKYNDLLKASLFYGSWAKEAEQYMENDAKVDSHPVWGRLRKLRFKQDFLFSYPEKDKILGLLFNDNHDNKMALDYFLGDLLLKGNVQAFAQYLQWAQQFGGYQQMPLGYQDAVRTIQSQGRAQDTRYGEYVRRMMTRKGGQQ